MKKYVLELRSKDFYDLANKFKNLRLKLPLIQNEILNELAEYTRERMIYYIDKSVNQEYATGNLSQSVLIQQINDSEIKVYVDQDLCPYAIYVEYGTGVVGAGTHPEYSGKYKQEGWWYPTTASDPNPNKRQLANGDWVVYTEGQVAHKFVYNAYQDLRSHYKFVVMRILKKEGYI